MRKATANQPQQPTSLMTYGRHLRRARSISLDAEVQAPYASSRPMLTRKWLPEVRRESYLDAMRQKARFTNWLSSGLASRGACYGWRWRCGGFQRMGSSVERAALSRRAPRKRT